MVDDVKRSSPELRIPVVDGEFALVCDPAPERPTSWMVNDHGLIREAQGNLRVVGIENPVPTTAEALHGRMHGYLYGNGQTHYRVGHAVAKTAWGPRRRLPAAQVGGPERITLAAGHRALTARPMPGNPVDRPSRLWQRAA